jgi:biofilm PGA synthesis protein PgaD
MNPLIINRPELQSTGQRVLYPIITFAFWMLWLYIWLPLLSLIAWAFGVQLFYDEMILENGFEAFSRLAGGYALVILILAATLLGWAQYNWRRFRNRERRKMTEVLSPRVMAEHFKVDARELYVWHNTDRMVVHFNSQGDIERVETDYGEVTDEKIVTIFKNRAVGHR